MVVQYACHFMQINAIMHFCKKKQINNVMQFLFICRYIAISHPLAYAQYGTNGGRALISISLVWGVSLAVGMPVFMGANQLDDATEVSIYKICTLIKGERERERERTEFK